MVEVRAEELSHLGHSLGDPFLRIPWRPHPGASSQVGLGDYDRHRYLGVSGTTGGCGWSSGLNADPLSQRLDQRQASDLVSGVELATIDHEQQQVGLVSQRLDPPARLVVVTVLHRGQKRFASKILQLDRHRLAAVVNPELNRRIVRRLRRPLTLAKRSSQLIKAAFGRAVDRGDKIAMTGLFGQQRQRPDKRRFTDRRSTDHLDAQHGLPSTHRCYSGQ